MLILTNKEYIMALSASATSPRRTEPNGGSIYFSLGASTPQRRTAFGSLGTSMRGRPSKKPYDTMRDLINAVNKISEKMKRQPDDQGELKTSYDTHIQEFRTMINEESMRDDDIPQIELLKDKNIMSALFQSPYARKLGQDVKTSLLRHMKQLSFQSTNNGYKPYSNELTAENIAHEFKDAYVHERIKLSPTELSTVEKYLKKQPEGQASDDVSVSESESSASETEHTQPVHPNILEHGAKALNGLHSFFKNITAANDPTVKAKKMIDRIKIIRDRMARIKETTDPHGHQDTHDQYNKALGELKGIMKDNSFNLMGAIHAMHSIKDYKVEGLIFETGQIEKVIENEELKEELFGFMDFLKTEEDRGIDYERKYGLEFVLRSSQLAEMFLEARENKKITLTPDECEKMKNLIAEDKKKEMDVSCKVTLKDNSDYAHFPRPRTSFTPNNSPQDGETLQKGEYTNSMTTGSVFGGMIREFHGLT